jgi:hypothetical protein
MLNRYEFFREDLILEGIINETYIYYAPPFEKALKRIKDNQIANELLNVKDKDIKPDVTFVNIDKEGYLSFTTARNAGNNLNKIWKHIKPEDWFNTIIHDSDLESIWGKHEIGDENDVYTKSRNSLRVGRFINKLFPGKFNDKQIEEFVNKFKSSLEVEGEKFELVEGDDIAKWYHYKNYTEMKGTLGNSCMKDKSDSIFKIYTKNPDVCKLLILREDDKILGRALVWKLASFYSLYNDHKPEYYMDRQYYIKESDVEKFKKYAEEQGWAYKSYNNHHSFSTVKFNGEEFNAKMTIQLGKSGGDYDYGRYPYVDTFRRYDPISGILYNDDDEDSKNEGQYILADTGGGYSEIESGVWSEWHDRRIPEDEAIWSDWADSYLYRDRAVQVTEGNRRYRGWYPDDCDDITYDEWSEEYIHIDDSVYSERYGHSLLADNAVEVIGDIDSDGDVSEADSNWHHKDDDDNILETSDLDSICYDRLTDLYRDWRNYEYIEKILLTKNYKEDWILKEFKIEVYPIKEAKDNSVDITGIEWLTKIDAEILGYELGDKEMVTDEFRYHNDIKDILPIIYRICERESSKISDTLEDKGQLRLKFDYEDDKEYLHRLENKLRSYNLRISDIDNKIYIDIDIEDEKNEKLKMKNLKRFEKFSNEHTQDEMENVWRKLNNMAKNYGDDVWELIELAFDQNRMSIEDFVNKLPEDLGDHNYIVSVLNQIKKEGI